MALELGLSLAMKGWHGSRE